MEEKKTSIQKAGIFIFSAFAAWAIGKILDGTSISVKLVNLGKNFQVFDFLNHSIAVWELFIWLAVSIGLYLAISKLFGKAARKNRKEEKRNEFVAEWNRFVKNNSRKLYEDGQLLVKFDVNIVNDKVEVKNLVPYCNKHDKPLKMGYNDFTYEYQCIDSRCGYRINHLPNGVGVMYDKYNEISSEMEWKWDEISKKAINALY